MDVFSWGIHINFRSYKVDEANNKGIKIGKKVHALWYASVSWDSMKRSVGTTSINISMLLEFQPDWQFRAGAWKRKRSDTFTDSSLRKVCNMLQCLSK
jgi:hypothetical protein